MKTRHFFPVLLIVAFGLFQSCDLLKKASEVDFDISLSLPFLVNETAVNPGGKAYSDSKLLDASSDPDVAKYADKISEFKVTKVTYTVSGANPSNVQFTNGTLKVASTGKTIASVSSVNLASTAETELTADLTGFDDLAAKLLDDNQETILLQGTLSSTPVTFTVNFKFYITVTASAL